MLECGRLQNIKSSLLKRDLLVETQLRSFKFSVLELLIRSTFLTN